MRSLNSLNSIRVVIIGNKQFWAVVDCLKEIIMCILIKFYFFYQLLLYDRKIKTSSSRHQMSFTPDLKDCFLDLYSGFKISGP